MEKKGVRLGCIWSAMWSIDASSYGRFFWFIVILIADVFCDVDEKVIYNVSMQTMVGMTSLTLVLCALGIEHLKMKEREKYVTIRNNIN